MSVIDGSGLPPNTGSRYVGKMRQIPEASFLNSVSSFVQNIRGLPKSTVTNDPFRDRNVQVISGDKEGGQESGIEPVLDEKIRNPLGSSPTDPNSSIASPVPVEMVEQRFTPSPLQIIDFSRRAVEGITTKAISNQVSSTVDEKRTVEVRFNQNSPDMEVTRITSYRRFSPEEEISINMRYIQRCLKRKIDEISSPLIDGLKGECLSLIDAAKGLPVSESRVQILAELDELYNKVCKCEIDKKLKELENSITALLAKQDGSYSEVEQSVRKLQSACREIYEEAKKFPNRSEIEDICHRQYMRLFDVIRQAKANNSACYDSLKVFADAHQEGSKAGIDSLGIHAQMSRVTGELGKLARNNPHIPAGKLALFEKDDKYNEDKGPCLTTEEKGELRAITQHLFFLNDYEEGVKKFLEFRQSIFRIENIIDEASRCNPAALASLEKKLQSCKLSIGHMMRNRDLVAHVSLQELEDLNSQVETLMGTIHS